MNKITVVAAAVNQESLTLYKPDGSIEVIPQGDIRVKVILEKIQPVILRGESLEIDLEDYGPQVNHYKEVEEKSGGVMRFFRVAKNAIKKLFGSDDPTAPVPNMVLGKAPKVPEDAGTKEETTATVSSAEKKLSNAVETILATAKPAVSHVPVNEDKETIVAVVTDSKGASKVIPNVQNLHGQVVHSSVNNNVKGLARFMERISAIIGQRQHSVDDLLKFMKRGDLPIADDGCIIIYKVLNKRNGHYVDVHSGNVTQRIGSYVFMAPSLVDHNRRNECSNGLHVARRNYVSQFNGDVCVIAKVAPEDVIAVPIEDLNKMRVCGYHIIDELGAQEYSLLRANKPITDTVAGQQLLAKVIAGQHPPYDQTVEITGPKGGGLKINNLGHQKKPAIEVTTPVKAIDIDQPLIGSGPIVDPKTLSTTVAETKKEVVEEPAKPPVEEVKGTPVQEKTEEKKTQDAAVIANGTPREKMKLTLERFDASKTANDRPMMKKWAREAIQIKRQAKKSWELLGVSEKKSQEFLKLTKDD